MLVFDVPSKGSNITLSEVLEEHKEAITDMASECSGSLVLTYSNFPVIFVNHIANAILCVLFVMFGSVDLNYWWLKCFNIQLASFCRSALLI